MRKLKRGKKALSPVIATVLLIALVIIIAIIIFIWARSFIKEVVQKQGRPAEQACDDINILGTLSNEELLLENNGNVPVSSINLKKIGAGSKDAERIADIKLAPGASYIYPDSITESKVEIVPSVMGETKSGKTEYTCANKKIEVEAE